MSEKQRKKEKEQREGAFAREKEITAAQAKAVIEQRNAERVQSCREKIEKACTEEHCAITAEVLLRQGQVIPRILIIPKSEGEKK